MSRRGKTIVKRVVLDPKFNSELVAHMIRVIMKDGKKTVAEKIVYGAIEKVAEKMKEDPSKFVKDEKQFEDPLEVVSAAIDNSPPTASSRSPSAGRRSSRARATAWACLPPSPPRSSTRSRVRATSSRSATTCTRWRRPTRRSRITPGNGQVLFQQTRGTWPTAASPCV